MARSPKGEGAGKPLDKEELKKLRESVGLGKDGPTKEQKQKWQKEESKDD